MNATQRSYKTELLFVDLILRTNAPHLAAAYPVLASSGKRNEIFFFKLSKQ